MRPTAARAWGWVNRQNNVPHYQRMFQRHDGLRQWNQTPKSKLIMPAYYTLIWGTTAATMYMMGRLVFGHKTWFS